MRWQAGCCISHAAAKKNCFFLGRILPNMGGWGQRGTVSQIKITNSGRTKIHLLCSQISQKPWGFGKDLQKNGFFYALPNTQFSAYFCGISYEWNLGSLFSNSWISKFEMQNCSLSRNCSHTWHLPHSSENLFVCWFFMKDVCWFYDQDLHRVPCSILPFENAPDGNYYYREVDDGRVHRKRGRWGKQKCSN